MSFTAKPATVKEVTSSWKRWLPAIERLGLSIVQVGRRADLARGSTAADIADDYAAVIDAQWGRAVPVFGLSSGGHFAQWLAIRHPALVERLVLGFTAHRVPPDVLVIQQRAVDQFLAGKWRAGWSEFGVWFMPNHPRIGRVVTWIAGPIIGGRYDDLRVLTIDNDADQHHDATPELHRISCPTLVCSGGRDTAYPPDLVRELVAGIPDVRHIEYPTSSHMGPGTVFGEDACAFLAATDPHGVAP